MNEIQNTLYEMKWLMQSHPRESDKLLELIRHNKKLGVFVNDAIIKSGENRGNIDIPTILTLQNMHNIVAEEINLRIYYNADFSTKLEEKLIGLRDDILELSA